MLARLTVTAEVYVSRMARYGELRCIRSSSCLVSKRFPIHLRANGLKCALGLYPLVDRSSCETPGTVISGSSVSICVSYVFTSDGAEPGISRRLARRGGRDRMRVYCAC